MPIKTSTATGAPCWIDLASSDLPKARKFYSELFGWTFDESNPAEYGGYTNARKDGQMVAGVSPHHPEYGGVPNVWSIYMKTENAAKTAAAVEAAGGKVLVPPMHVAPFGHMAVFLDATGASVGVWQPEQHEGFGREGEPGTPCWHELHARDFSAALAFYEKVFGWKLSVVSDTDDFRYVTHGKGDGALAGIMDDKGWLVAETPSFWTTYWGSADVDADCAKIKSLGGSVLIEPADSPYGRFAHVADPCGARFMLLKA